MGNQIRPRRGTTVWRRSAALTVLLALSVSFPLVAVAAPSIQLSPDEGIAGSTFTVTGSGFGLLVPVTILWDGTGIATTTPTVTGDIEVSVTVPQGAELGRHRVVASQPAFPNASATFTVEAPPTTTTSTSSTTTTTTQSTTTTTIATTTSTSAPATTTTTNAPPTSQPPDTSTTSTSSDTTTTTSPNRSTPTTSTVSTTGPTSTTADPEPELRMDPLNSSDPFGPEVMAADVVAGNPDSAPPRLAGGALRVTNVSVSPSSGMPGTNFEVSVTLEGAIPGLSTVRVLVADEALGDPIVVDGDRLDVQAMFPELPPGTYPLVVVDDKTVLAGANVQILDEPTPSSRPAVLVGLMMLTVSGLGWGAHWVAHRSGPQQL